MFAVTGAAGHLGRLTIQHLLRHVPASTVLATTCDPARLADLAEAGVTVRRADFADPASLPTAFAGATRLLMISVNGVFTGPRVAQHRAVIAAAVATGVGYIAYTSAIGADPAAPSVLARDHGLTEAASPGRRSATASTPRGWPRSWRDPSRARPWFSRRATPGSLR